MVLLLDASTIGGASDKLQNLNPSKRIRYRITWCDKKKNDCEMKYRQNNNNNRYFGRRSASHEFEKNRRVKKTILAI